MKLNKIKDTRTFVQSISLTPKEFLELMLENCDEVVVKIPNLHDRDKWSWTVGEDDTLPISLTDDGVEWDGTHFVIAFLPDEGNPNEPYEDYMPEVTK